MIALDLATTFAGGIFICGVMPWRNGDRPNLDTIQSSRYVFLTVERDQALASTRQAFRSYQDAGVTNIDLVVVRGMGHTNPPRKEVAKAIEFPDKNLSN